MKETRDGFHQAGSSDLFDGVLFEGEEGGAERIEAVDVSSGADVELSGSEESPVREYNDRPNDIGDDSTPRVFVFKPPTKSIRPAEGVGGADDASRTIV